MHCGVCEMGLMTSYLVPWRCRTQWCNHDLCRRLPVLPATGPRQLRSTCHHRPRGCRCWIHLKKVGVFQMERVEITELDNSTWAPSQYPKRRLSVRSRKVSKPRDLYLELPDRSEIWQAVLPMCLSNFKAIRQSKVPISWLRDFTRSYENTSFRILRRGPGSVATSPVYSCD